MANVGKEFPVQLSYVLYLTRIIYFDPRQPQS